MRQSLRGVDFEHGKPTGDLCQLIVPLEFFKKISDIASKHNKTTTQFIAEAIGYYIKEIEKE